MEEKFKEIFEKSPIGILFYDKEGKLVDANQSALQIERVPKFEDIKGINLFVNPNIESRKEELFKNGIIKFQSSRDLNTAKEYNFYTPTKYGIIYIDYTISVTNSGFLMQIQDITEQKKAEDVEKRLNALIDNNPSLVFMKDEQGKYVYLNNAYEKQFIHTKDWYGKTDFDFWPKESAELFQANDTEVLESGKIHQFLEDSTDMNGTRYVWLNYKFPFTDLNGRKYVGGIGIDVTSRVVAEEALKESEELYRGVIENTTAIILRINPQGLIQFANDRALDFFGYSEEELIGKHAVGTIVPETDTTGHDLAKMVDEITENPDSFHSNENENMLKNGERVWMEWTNSGIYDNEGNLKEFLSVGIDATERKKAGNALKESEAQLKTIIENLEEGLVVSDMDGTLIHWNPTAIKMHGFSSIEEGIRKFPEFANIFELSTMDGNVLPVNQWPAARILRGERLKDFEVNIRRIDSNWERKFNYGGTLVRDAQNQPLMAVITLIDITERKKAEEELKQAHDHLEEKVEERTVELEESNINLKESEEKLKDIVAELERSNEELQSFAYITSHDLQEPLRTLGNYAGLLKRRYAGQLDEDADDFLEFMADGAVRMKNMIQGLLEYSRINRGEIKSENIDMNIELEEAISNLKNIIDESNTKITHNRLPKVYADPKQMVSVFQNLIGNAIKFKKPQFPPRIHISAKKYDKRNEWVFSVEDNGIGMEKEYTNRIFEVFKRLHTIDEYEGTGIGLAIVKRIVESNGGRIWVESEFGVGSTFYFTIPVNK